MKEKELEKLQQQHYKNYIQAINEIVKNNTNSLFDIDINSLINIPPLDSMDQIKAKLISLAKKENVILKAEVMNEIVDNYRKKTALEIFTIKDYRINQLTKEIEKSINHRDKAMVKLTKKQMNIITIEVKKRLKNIITTSVEKNIVKKIDLIFSGDVDIEQKEKFKKEFIKFVSNRGLYQKQFFDSIEFKLLVKDTTLMNGIKEQSDRYLFTINNSRLFNN